MLHLFIFAWQRIELRTSNVQVKMFKFLSLITKLVISSHDFMQIVAVLQTTMSPTVCVYVPSLTENVLSQKICIVITYGTIV